ncbi:MAG: efflux RND transporter periplasmic adaptor subunit [Candidatus Taylorbacteria bacterium]
MRKHLSRLYRLLKNKWFIAFIILLVIFLAYFIFRSTPKPNIEYSPVTVGNVIERVSITGKILPVAKADLSFEKSGVVTKINFKVGDRVKKGDTIASLDSAGDKAALKVAQAELAGLMRGLRPEEYAAYLSTLKSSSTTLENTVDDAVNAIRDGYVKAHSAMVEYVDLFFDNPQSVNPIININIDTYEKKISLNNQRLAVSDTLLHWKNDVSIVNTQNVFEILTNCEKYLSSIKGFTSEVSTIVNNLNPGSSGLPQTVINTKIVSINTALSSMTQAIDAISRAGTALRSTKAAFDQANKQFKLQNAGSSAESIAAQRARVLQAQVILDNDNVVSPIAGIITRVEPKSGEFVVTGQSGFSVQSDLIFKIEAYVPEADIAKVVLDNDANVTLDAYGSNVIFPAKVTMIDPAETVLDGVPTYKVTLQFVSPDNRIRSGMTANTDILTNKKDNVVMVSSRAVIDEKGKRTVRVMSIDGKSFVSVPVTIGLKGSDGTSEVISGLKEGDNVVTFVK